MVFSTQSPVLSPQSSYQTKEDSKVPDPRQGGIAVLDYGSQYTQLIARRVREQGVYAEVFPCDADPVHIQRHQPRGVILSGGPNSIYEDDAPQLPEWLGRGVAR